MAGRRTGRRLSDLPVPRGDASGGVARAELSPLSFLRRSAEVWAERPAVRSGDRTRTYAELADRVGRTIGALRREFGIEPGGRIATILPNVPAMLELHYAVPGCGGVLVPLNTRLAPPEYDYILGHSGAEVVFADARLRDDLGAALGSRRVIWVDDSRPSECGYEQLLEGGSPEPMRAPLDENAILSINYTSGTTGRPKGVIATHRGAYLHSLGVVVEAGLDPASVYLWTLPMFHCNGWAYTWAVTAAGGLHVYLPQVEEGAIWAQLEADVTHLCAAPTVLEIILRDTGRAALPRPVRAFVGGAPPSPTILARAADLGFEMTHLYGLTETYGPIAVCAWNPDWDRLPAERRYRLMARQGVATILGEPLAVLDADQRSVPRDGETLGEIAMRGNNVTPGYYHDPEATATAMRGGWFHSGDLGVIHPDGYVEIRDRLKDVIISGGENISSIEIEQALAAYPPIAEASVVGAADERWGEVPVAFVTLGDGQDLEVEAATDFVRSRIARFKAPKRITVVAELPKTATGKVQKNRLRELL
jgi:fatty-acyl-CoA synthase